MPKPIEVYNDLLKEFEITDRVSVHPENKLLYLRSQRDEQKAIINRLLFDMATSQIHQNEAKDPTTKDAHRKKYDDYKADVRQLLRSLNITLDLLEALEPAPLKPEA